MTDSDYIDGGNAHFTLRGIILETLYAHFKRFPDAPVDVRHLVEACASEPTQLNWNLVYLEKSGLIQLGRSETVYPFIACSVELTAGGIDLVEDRKGFVRRFHLPESSASLRAPGDADPDGR